MANLATDRVQPDLMLGLVFGLRLRRFGLLFVLPVLWQDGEINQACFLTTLEADVNAVEKRVPFRLGLRQNPAARRRWRDRDGGETSGTNCVIFLASLEDEERAVQILRLQASLIAVVFRGGHDHL
jgi:hypothetical protein